MSLGHSHGGGWLDGEGGVGRGTIRVLKIYLHCTHRGGGGDRWRMHLPIPSHLTQRDGEVGGEGDGEGFGREQGSESERANLPHTAPPPLPLPLHLGFDVRGIKRIKDREGEERESEREKDHLWLDYIFTNFLTITLYMGSGRGWPRGTGKGMSQSILRGRGGKGGLVLSHCPSLSLSCFLFTSPLHPFPSPSPTPHPPPTPVHLTVDASQSQPRKGRGGNWQIYHLNTDGPSPPFPP